MHTEWVAKEVLYFDTIDSTNIKAQELAEKGYPSGTLVVADKQESGKGVAAAAGYRRPAQVFS